MGTGIIHELPYVQFFMLLLLLCTYIINMRGEYMSCMCVSFYSLNYSSRFFFCFLLSRKRNIQHINKRIWFMVENWWFLAWTLFCFMVFYPHLWLLWYQIAENWRKIFQSVYWYWWIIKKALIFIILRNYLYDNDGFYSKNLFLFIFILRMTF